MQRYVRTAQLDHVNDTPHLTVGVATFDDLEIIEAEPPMGQAAR